MVALRGAAPSCNGESYVRSETGGLADGLVCDDGWIEHAHDGNCGKSAGLGCNVRDAQAISVRLGDTGRHGGLHVRKEHRGNIAEQNHVRKLLEVAAPAIGNRQGPGRGR